MKGRAKAAAGRCCNEHHRPTRTRHAEPRHRPVPRRTRLPLPRRLDRPRRQQQHRGRTAHGLADEARLHAARRSARPLYKLRTEADNHNRSLYGNNQAVYSLLRYGVPVKIEAGKVTETVHLIDWDEPEKNDFAIAEEVTLKRRPRAAARPRALRQRHRHRRAGAEEQPRHHRRRHPPEPLQPAAGVQRLVLQHRAVRLRRQRLRGAAIRHHRHARRNTSCKWKEDEADNSRFKLDKYLLKMCDKERLIELMHDFVLFDGGVKKLPRVHQYFGIKAAQEHVRATQGRHHLAHAGQRQEHRHGAAGQVDSGEQSQRPRRHHHRPRRAGQADRAASSPRRARPIKRTSSGRDLMTPARPGHAAPALLAGPQVRPQGRGRLRRLHQGAGGAAQPDGGRGVRVRGRVPPHPERQAAPRDEGDDAQRGVHRLHRHAAAEEGQGRPAWKSSAATSTPTSSARRWRTRWCSTWSTRRATSTSGSAREDKIDAWFEAKTKGLNDWQKDELKKQVGHDAERAQLQLAHGAGGRATSFSTSASSRACPASAATPSWWRRASTRRASISRCSRRRRSRASARSSPPTTRRRRT